MPFHGGVGTTVKHEVAGEMAEGVVVPYPGHVEEPGEFELRGGCLCGGDGDGRRRVREVRPLRSAFRYGRPNEQHQHGDDGQGGKNAEDVAFIHIGVTQFVLPNV